MNLGEDIKPISYIKTNAADMLKRVNETHNPIVITQNGEAKAVLLDTESYQDMRNSLGILKILAEGEKAAEEGHKVVLIERDNAVGGVLNQCIHNGFGLQYFGEDYTGPEFKEVLEEKVRDNQVKIISNSNVLELYNDKRIKFINREGIHDLEFKALVLTTGARERHINSLGITGDRPAGVFTAGLAQRYINLMNLKPGNKALIVGSGDIGLIMARRLTLEGVEVKGVVEINSYPGGLDRNIQQCLKDFDIPLYLSHSVRRIIGKNRRCYC